MKILAIESSGMPASVALLDGEILTAEYTLCYRKTHSQTLLPMLDEICRMTETDLGSVDAIAVSSGPGSFTGLRIGSASAKGLALGLDKPIVSVPTLEGMAYNYCGSPYLICPMLDARRSQVFTGIYTFETRFCVLQDMEAVDAAAVAQQLNALAAETGKTVVLLGDGTAACRNILEETLEAPHLYAPAHLNAQRAGSVAMRALELFREGKTETAASHRPEYLRVSQAERVRAEKLRAAAAAE